MKNGGWIPIDKRFINLMPKDRKYTYLEAMFSYSVDQDNGKNGSVNGYAKLWEWSRNKVRKFINELRTGKGQVVDRKGTGKGQVVRFIFNNLDDVRDRKGTGSGQEGDRKRYTTIYPNPNPNLKKTFSRNSDELRLSELLLSLILERNPNHKKPNLQIWAKSIDLMTRIDKRQPENIEKITRWCQQDTFWQNNILSTDKLRKQYDRLKMKMESDKKTDKTDMVKILEKMQDENFFKKEDSDDKR